MRVRMTRDTLLQALKQAARAVVFFQGNVASQSFLHIEAKEGDLLLKAVSAVITVEVRVRQEEHSCLAIEEEGRTAVSAQLLLAIVQRLDQGWLTIEWLQEHKLAIKSGGSSFRLNCLNEEEFPTLSTSQQDLEASLRLPASWLSSAISQVMIAVPASDRSSHVLQGVSVLISTNFIALTATDGVQLAYCSLPINTAASYGPIMIPGRTFVELSRLMNDKEGTILMEAGARSVRFSTSRWQMVSVLLNGTIPSVEKLVPKTKITEICLKGEALFKAVNRTALMADSEKRIGLKHAEKGLVLSARKAEIGEATEQVELEACSGEEFTLSVNVMFLSEMVKCLQHDIIRFYYAGSRSPIILVPDRKEGEALFLLTPILTAASPMTRTEGGATSF